MSERRNALGKGLEQLFSDDSMTFEELIGEICNGIDLIFICKRSILFIQ